EPQPLEFFDPDKAPSRLTRWREKYQFLKEQGVDRMVCAAFNHETAALSAEDFVTTFLLNKVGVKHLVIGDDFRFGQGRQGDYDLLCKLGEKHDYNVERSKTFLIENERVSSSRIRKALESDQLELAARLLGRPYSISGRVAHGNKQGRELGFPTANIELRRMKTALHGIFIAQVKLDDQKSRPSVAYIGSKPTLGGARTLLEVHLFGYSGNLYGQYIKVEFLQKLRDDKRFDSVEILKDQISADAKAARDYFSD
ncbi:MAG: bifunctional riboflavin kinase/FAD synthetase, partial [Gammaproteobacteria bacterium]